jgi:hypothetical protein
MAIRRDFKGQQQGAKAAKTPVAPTRVIVRKPETLVEEPAVQLVEGQPKEKNVNTLLFGTPNTKNLSQAWGVGQDSAMHDPVVGWLVIVVGPGRGNALTLGYGLNGIGRGPRARVRLDFGDLEISRDQHAVITYDPKGRRFYLQHGGGTNLTYLDQQPVLVPSELKGDEIIVLGQTQLRFIPFCGANFDWQDAHKRE